MINKRGLTPQEFECIDDELFQYLMVYDTFVEPSGIKIEMLKHAHLCQTITLNNSNMTKEVAKGIKTKDYDFLGILDEGTTKERRNNRKVQEETKKQESNASYFASRYEQIKGKNNGKE